MEMIAGKKKKTKKEVKSVLKKKQLPFSLQKSEYKKAAILGILFGNAFVVRSAFHLRLLSKIK